MPDRDNTTDATLVTLGEVYRVCLDVRDETRKTNGRLQAAERMIAVHNWAFGLIGAALLAWAGVLLAKLP